MKAMGPPTGTGSRNWLWPDVVDLESATAAGIEGTAAAFIVAGITTIFAVLSYCDVLDVVSPWALVDANAMALLGFLIHRMSRSAAVIALVWFIVARIQGAVAHGFASNVLLGLILLPGFISGIRGTLAYHRLAGRTVGLKRSKSSLTLVFTSSVARILRRRRRRLIES
jgi:hypothetical protein